MSIKQGDISIPDNLPAVRRGDKIAQKVCRGDVEVWSNGVQPYVWARAAGDDYAADALSITQSAPTLLQGFIAPTDKPFNRLFPRLDFGQQMQAIMRIEGFNSLNWIDAIARSSVYPQIKTAPSGGTIGYTPTSAATVDIGGGRRSLPANYSADYSSYIYVTGDFVDDFYVTPTIWASGTPAITSGADMRISPNAKITFTPIVLDAVLPEDQVLTTSGVGRFINFEPVEMSGWTYLGPGNFYTLRSSGSGGGTTYVLGLMYLDITFVPSVTGNYSFQIAGVTYVSIPLVAGVPWVLKDFAIGFGEGTANMGLHHAYAVPAGGSVTVKAGARMRHGRDSRVYIQRLQDFTLASATVGTAFDITKWIPDTMRMSMFPRGGRPRYFGNVIVEWTGNAGANPIGIAFWQGSYLTNMDGAPGRGLAAADVIDLGGGRYRANIPIFGIFANNMAISYNQFYIRGQFFAGGSTAISNVVVSKDSWIEVVPIIVEAYLPTDTVVTVNQRIRGWVPKVMSEWRFEDDTFITPPNYGPAAQDPFGIYSSIKLDFICSKSGTHIVHYRNTGRVKGAVATRSFTPVAVGDGTYSYTWSITQSYSGYIVAEEPLEFYFSTIPVGGTVTVKAGAKLF